MGETDFKDTFKETLQFINQDLKRKGGFMNSSNVNFWLHQGKVEEWKIELTVFEEKEMLDLKTKVLI